MKEIATVFVGTAILLIAASDTVKGFLMLTRGTTSLLFIAAVAFRLIRLLPEPTRQKQLEKAMRVYDRRRKMYGVFAVIGGLYGILLGLIVILNAWSLQ